MNDLIDRSTALGQSAGKSPEVAANVERMRAEFKTALGEAREAAQECEERVRCHQRFQDRYNETVDWLNEVGEKLNTCNDLRGDKHAIESRLDRLKVRLRARSADFDSCDLIGSLNGAP